MLASRRGPNKPCIVNILAMQTDLNAPTGFQELTSQSANRQASADPIYYYHKAPSLATRAARWMLPYGCWTVQDGREILFDRRYCPILQRFNGGPAMPADRSEWVDGIEATSWFYTGSTPEAACRAAGIEALRAWGWGLAS